MDRMKKLVAAAVAASFILINMAGCQRVDSYEGPATADTPVSEAPSREPDVSPEDNTAAEGEDAANAPEDTEPAAGNPDAPAEPAPEPDGQTETATVITPSSMTLEEVMAAADDPEVMERVKLYFSDSLFVGDSRTVGLGMYSGIDTADYFATTGMTSFELFDPRKPAKINNRKVIFNDFLAEKTYGKIFVMLGINELGYDLESVINEYAWIIGEIAARQPQATITVMANMHVTVERSEKDKIYNNDRINNVNAGMHWVAEGRGLGFLDVNPLFDDENGHLNAAYTFDHTHVLGKYYKGWSVWIYDSMTHEGANGR